jgi:hypothetical protein
VYLGSRCVENTIYVKMCAKCTHDERPSAFIKDKPIFSSDRMLHKDHYRKGAVGEKKFLVVGFKGLNAKTN